MLVAFIYGVANTDLVVEYRILESSDNDILVVIEDWTSSGVLEASAGSGTYLVFVPADTLSGRTVESRLQGTTKTTVESFPPMSSGGGSGSFDVSMLSQYDSIKMGQGLGSRVVDTTSLTFADFRVTDGVRGVKGVVVRAFPSSGGSVSWSTLKGRHTTNRDGNWRMYLDPGTYVLSYEKAGVQLKTDDITVI